MPCFHPIPVWTDGKKIHFKGLGGPATMHLPCGRCIGCKLERSRQWAVRCMHEAQLHEANSFVNLTFNEENCPASLPTENRDFALFMKRLRKRRPPKSVSYMMCGEYGEQNLRPHYHAILFGVGFADRTYWCKSPSGFPLYRSAELEDLWTEGNSTIGDVTFESAAYVARYTTKKLYGEREKKRLTRLDPATGQLIEVLPEFGRMSLRPALGKRWIDKYPNDVFPHDRVVMNGCEAKPPRYYDKQLEKLSPAAYLQLKERRKKEASTRKDDNTEERLKTKEKVTTARLNLKKRPLE